ncbi:MAG: glycosyl hydrolase family 57 [Chloroflexi bacterium]|nr:glycosyl hydrolase family 57 [Chloroflexota bacterium]
MVIWKYGGAILSNRIVDGWPVVTGHEEEIARAMALEGPFYAPATGVQIADVQAAFGMALHMHQPIVPEGRPDGGSLRDADLTSYLDYMMRHQAIHDNHNAPVFEWCYRRMGHIVPELVDAGKNPRIMLDYSGDLLWGLAKMGKGDVLDDLKNVTLDRRYWPYVEWLGTFWSHPVAPSTPANDLRLHIRAWQENFAAIFGFEALSRVRGFSLPEMALPNNPDQCYEMVKALVEAGYRWVMVQEHTVENLDGSPIKRPHLPHVLVARNSRGQVARIVALVKTQGSDTKLVAQLQPFYEAQSLSGPQELCGKPVPRCVFQIGDGENGGVMMNEFPPKYKSVFGHEIERSGVISLNGSEYLELLAGLECCQDKFIAIQPVWQHRVWARVGNSPSPEAVAKAIEECRKEDGRFYMDRDGGNWTQSISWTKGYERELSEIENVSALFHEKFPDPQPQSERYRRALIHLMLCETSCFRYWGQGIFTEYARELVRRTRAILEQG